MRWRVRLSFAAVPVCILMVQDVSPVAVFLFGALTAVAVMVGGSWLGGIEARVRRAKTRKAPR